MTQSDSNQARGQGLQGTTGNVDESLPDLVSELIANGSIELSSEDDKQIPVAAELLPYGMSVFVPSPRERQLLESLVHVRALHESGFEPVPHIAARKVGSREELEEFLKTAVADLGVHRVLLIGGDAREPCGPYADGAAILRDGILSDLGINEVGLAGYPEGHPNISQDTLLADLDDKLELIDRQGMCGEIVTQFCFAPSRIIEYCAYLAQKTPETPVYVGMAGPTSAARLIRYANYCGVSASLRALGSMGVKVVNLLTHTDPSEQLDALAHYCATRDACNVIGAHLFSFGGFVESARWMRQKCRQN